MPPPHTLRDERRDEDDGHHKQGKSNRFVEEFKGMDNS